MNWRPWLVLALLLAVVLVNSALIYFEEIEGPQQVAEVTDERKDDLALLPFTAAQRRSNFEAFGLPSDLVDAAATQAKRVETRQDRLGELLQEYAGDIGPMLCPGSGTVPQRYAALSFLVHEQGGQRVPLQYDRITYFEVQDWYDPGLVRDIYNEIELSEEPRANSTAMGVSALLLNQEDAVIEGQSPWGRGLGARWSLDRVLSEYPEVKRRLVEYFALMHVLTEMANKPGGICS